MTFAPRPIVLKSVAICCACADSVERTSETAIWPPTPPALIPATAAEMAELESMPPFCPMGARNARGPKLR